MIRQYSHSLRALLSGVVSLVLVATTSCTLSEQANCKSDADCEANQICLSSGGVLVRDAVCVDDPDNVELDAGTDADTPELDTDNPDAETPDAEPSDADVTPDAPDTDAGLQCEDDLEICDEQCININTDENYCGSCTNSCESTQECVEGACNELCDVDQLPFGAGAGSADDPYLICSPQQLAQINASDGIYLSEHFQLLTDLDLASESFEMIGTLNSGFSGVFDGKGHSLSNLSITTNENRTGMFQKVEEGAMIQDLHLVDANIEGRNFVGAMVGLHLGTLQNVSVSGTVSGNSSVGGLVGASADSLISNSESNATVSGEAYVGGLIGQHAGVIENSFAHGPVSGFQEIGGLVGQNWTGGDETQSPCEIVDSGATGIVTSENDGLSIGGLVGLQMNNCSISGSTATGDVNAQEDGEAVGGLVGDSRPEATIINSHAEGDVSGEQFVGGLVGRVASFQNEPWSESEPSIQMSSARGSVSGQRDEIGGLVGRSEGSTIASFATGQVEGDKFVGGLVGNQQQPSLGIGGQIAESYSTSQVFGENHVGGLVGLSESQISNCYALGDVSGGTHSGGLIGELREAELLYSFYFGALTSSPNLSTGALVGDGDDGLIVNSYWNSDSGGINTNNGGEPLTPAQFTNPNSFDGWSLGTIWTLNSGVHPELAWQ